MRSVTLSFEMLFLSKRRGGGILDGSFQSCGFDSASLAMAGSELPGAMESEAEGCEIYCRQSNFAL